jgi:hypothetical protein
VSGARAACAKADSTVPAKFLFGVGARLRYPRWFTVEALEQMNRMGCEQADGGKKKAKAGEA